MELEDLNKEVDLTNPRHLVLVVVVLSVLVSSIFGFTVGFFGGELISNSAQINNINNSIQLNTDPYYSGTTDHEQAIIKAVRQSSPAVVSIIQSRDVPIIENCIIDPFDEFRSDPFFRQFFGDSPFSFEQPCQQGMEKREVGGGSGFIISDDGLIVTNKHVVLDEDAEYTVLTNDGEKYEAKVLARDPFQDLAIIQIEASDLAVVQFGDSDKLHIGQSVVAIGNALGEFRNTVSVGTVSGLARSVVASGAGAFVERLDQVIQTDAAINPGNSGGPLLNLKSEVVGINTAIAQGAENIGFAIPINRVERAISDVKKEGRIIYPFLGVRYVIIDETIKEENDLPVENGALIQGRPGEESVIEGSPADKVGIQDGDIILEINNEKITEEHALAEIIQRFRPGDTITLKILRKKDILEVQATLDEFDEEKL
jgi:S1-C subfamily serine protease